MTASTGVPTEPKTMLAWMSILLVATAVTGDELSIIRPPLTSVMVLKEPLCAIVKVVLVLAVAVLFTGA